MYIQMFLLLLKMSYKLLSNNIRLTIACYPAKGEYLGVGREINNAKLFGYSATATCNFDYLG